jgi:hypothetical protein
MNEDQTGKVLPEAVLKKQIEQFNINIKPVYYRS